MPTRPRFAALAAILGRLGLIGGAALALVASTEAGDRSDGTCPAGETCAPETPDGLLFEGAPLGTWPALTAHTIAAGGRQTFRITYPGSDRAPFDLPFTADATGAGHAIVGTGPDRVSVSATGASTGHLRILDDAGQLYDRLSIESAHVTTMRAAPAYGTAYPHFDPPRWAAFAGGEATVSIVLADGRGEQVVDEGLAVRSPVPAVRTSWDSFTLTTPTAGIVALAVDAGDVRDREVRVPVVDVFDEIVVSAPQESGVGGDVRVCFVPWLRGGQAGSDDDTLVVGVPRQYRVRGAATPLAVQPYAACLELHTDAGGPLEVEAVIGGRSWFATIDVRGSGAREAAGFAQWLAAPSEGERAALVAE